MGNNLPGLKTLLDGTWMSPVERARTDIHYTLLPEHIAVHTRASVAKENPLTLDLASPDNNTILIIEAEVEAIQTSTITFSSSSHPSPLPAAHVDSTLENETVPNTKTSSGETSSGLVHVGIIRGC